MGKQRERKKVELRRDKIYDAGRDVDDCFKEEFRKYVREQDLLCLARFRGRIELRSFVLRKEQQLNAMGFSRCRGRTKIWSWIFKKEQQSNAMHSVYTDIVHKLFLKLESHYSQNKLLVQFWRAEQVNSRDDYDERHCLLTTRNQPFLLLGYIPGSRELHTICSYRMRSADIDGRAGRGGVIGRVFRKKRMEFTPNVAKYSYEEYPNKDVALSCHIKASLILPLMWSNTGGRLLGVIEFVSPVVPVMLCQSLQMLQSECFNCCQGLFVQGVPDDFKHPVAKINRLIQMVVKSCNLFVGQSWMLCKLCGSMFTCDKLKNHHEVGYNLGKHLFLKAETSFTLQKEQGIVCNAVTSPHNLVYCSDVTKLGITPFAHSACKYACFAIGLQSNLTADLVYVLEFFLDPSHVKGRDLWALLVSIIQALGQNLQKHKLYFAEELKGYLSVLVLGAGIDVDGCFTKEFREYVQEQDLLCQRWEKLHTVDVDSNVDDGFKTRYWAFREKRQLDFVDSACIDIIDKLVGFFESRKFSGSFLVQFWKAEEVDGGNDCDHAHLLLTTRNQPFLLVEQLLRVEELNKICTYRMRMFDINNGDGGGSRGGVANRVFRNKRMEFTPDVAYYTYEEYPERDLAVSSHMKGSLFLPLLDSCGCSLGVMELVTPLDPDIFFWGFISDPLHETLQRGRFNGCKGLCGQYDIEENFELAVAEIKEVMDIIGKSCNLILGQTWMLCKLCTSISTCMKFGERLSASYQHFATGSLFLEAESAYNIKKGQGIVGKAAASSHHIVYCEDVSEISITEYPLAHFARKYNYSASFAISLQSIYTGDQVFVLEFFLDPRLVKGRDLWTALVSTIQTMMQKFQTFRFASGEEFGDVDALSVQIIDASSPDKFVTLRNIGLDLTLSVGENNLEVSRQYLLQHSIGETSTDGTYDPMIGVETSSPDSQTSSIQSNFQLKVKAGYGDVFIRFMLSACPTIHELNQHVSKKLQLEIGTYNFTYQDDDNDWILLTCDDDLREYAYSLAASGRSTSTMLIEPKHVS